MRRRVYRVSVIRRGSETQQTSSGWWRLAWASAASTRERTEQAIWSSRWRSTFEIRRPSAHPRHLAPWLSPKSSVSRTSPRAQAAYRPREAAKWCETTSSVEYRKPIRGLGFQGFPLVSEVPCSGLIIRRSQVRVLAGPPTKALCYMVFGSSVASGITVRPRPGRGEAARFWSATSRERSNRIASSSICDGKRWP